MTGLGLGSNLNSPSARSGNGPTGAVTLSSLAGDYAHVVVQVTKDLVPYVCSLVDVPVGQGIEMGVADLTESQLLTIYPVRGSRFEAPQGKKSNTAVQWARMIDKHVVSLEILLKVSYMK